MDILTAAGHALATLVEPMRFLILLLGVGIGLFVGIIPGLGGITAMVIMIPFTYGMDPYAAFAFLIGMWAVVPISDVIPAVFFGVPGTVGCAATILDGHPLAKQGQAARALGACYAASTLGGLFGAILLAVSIPILRPLMLLLGSPDLLAFSVFGLSMVASLSGGQPFRGIAAAALGLMIAMVGLDPQTGTQRWTFGELYLWDGVPLAPFALGLFALPELAALMIARSSVSGDVGRSGFSLRQQAQGFRDVLTHWWLMIRCSWLGAALGTVPGMGAAIIDWIAYGHALRTEKNPETFGTGDIRGVIASESSNHAREGGSLIPMIAFGIPGSASTALMLGAFLIQGLAPGPEMLTKHLDVTYAIIWSLAIATVIGAILCVLASAFLVKLVDLRYALLLPIVLDLAFVGAYEGGHRDWGDLVVFFAAGLVGWLMRELGWPRAPLLLGLVLGGIFERYLFISIQRYEFTWLTRPVVLIMFALSIYGVVRSVRRRLPGSMEASGSRWSRPHFGREAWFSTGFILFVGSLFAVSLAWPLTARIVPEIVGAIALLFALINLGLEVSSRTRTPIAADRRLAMDLPPSTAPDGTMLPVKLVFARGAAYFLWIGGALVSAAIVGLLPALFLFATAFIRVEGKERWRTAFAIGAAIGLGCWALFDRALGLTWPPALVGTLIPALRAASGGLV